MMKTKVTRLSIVLVILLLVFAPISVHAAVKENPDSVSFEDIDAYIEKQIKTLNIPSASLAIVENDRIVHMKGFGEIDSNGTTPAPQTPYFIGSLTKSFTALAIMQLVEEGKVDLDTPIQHYLPWFTLANPQSAAQITVRQLLNQTSGLPQTPGMLLLAEFDDTPGVMERQARSLSTLELTRPVGAEWEYSNLNFNLLGLIIEAVSGETYPDYMQNHVFSPLDMQHSYSLKTAAQEDNLVQGHQMWFGFPIAVPNMSVPIGSLPSGQLISSAEDIGHYLIAQLNDGEYNEVQILSPQGVAQMHQPAASISLLDNDMGDYGMGWFVQEITDGTLIFHYGEVPDYFAYMALLPEQDRAMVLLVNANEQMYNYAFWAMGETIALWLADVAPQSTAWAVLPWAERALLLLPFFQVIGISVTTKKFRRWQQERSARPGTAKMWLLYILLPSILNLILAVIAAAILASGFLQFSMLFMGGITSVLLLSGTIALVWLIIRTRMILSLKRS